MHVNRNVENLETFALCSQKILLTADKAKTSQACLVGLMTELKGVSNAQGAVADIGPTETAFFYRNSLFETQYFYHWSSGNQEGKAVTLFLLNSVS